MNQTNLFEFLHQNFNFSKPIRLIELFAGYGSQAMSLKKLQNENLLTFEHHKVVEFDKYAIKSYNAIHNTNFEVSDIRDIHACDLEITDKDKYHYIMTYSFPCQDLSKAGKQKGMSKGDNTRSGLLWEVERILGECYRDKCLPDVLLMENVPDVVGQKNYADFMKWYAALEACGYQSYYKILNAKDYGIPQNRERCFMVSILGDYNYTFLETFKLELRLKDMLEDEVDEKYYISDAKIKYMQETSFNSSSYDVVVQDEDVCRTLCARDYKDPKCVEVGKTDFGNNDSLNRIYSTDGLSPTLKTMQGGHQEPKIADQGGQMLATPEATKKGYALADVGDGVYINRPHQKRGVVQKGTIQTLKTSCNDVGVVVNDKKRIFDVNETFGTLGTNCGSSTSSGGGVVTENKSLRVRKLTPRECGRLMGVRDEDITKMLEVNSNSQCYKQFGNSIVVDVLYYIFKQMC